ncbi:hypothetical protein NM74_03555 [Aeromonas hydrophila]|uniref:undecaprenyl-phosphate glucose phosphotransferase n=1 Tax=Aeromonas hydrophila TaxID=644 RepID=UPI0005378000|nr:undecaprenyl-phosphate glucose phosphotransferase [Aeromonas hydrophila]KHA57989.1 hypothetical protein NM74_03555 [Aeromonas hydrophila]
MNKRIIRLADASHSLFSRFVDLVGIFISMLLLSRHYGLLHGLDEMSLATLGMVVFFLVSQNTGLYRSQVRNHLAQSLLRLFSTWVLTGSLLYLLICFVPLFQPHHAFTLNIGLLWLSLACLSSACYRLLYRLVTLCFSTPSHGRRVAIIGVTPTGLAIEKSLWENPTNDIQMLGFFDARSEDRFGYPTRSPVLGEVEKLLALARQGLVDEVYLALPLTARDRINHYLYELSDTTVDTYLVPDFYEYSLTVSQIKRVGDIYTFSVFDSPFEGGSALLKRIEDLVLGSLILLLISPVMVLVALGVRLSSPGPVLFKQDRYGLGGKRIRVWKFRSMRVMENDAVVTQATREDRRVTRFGAFLRRTSLDELPQFFNVIQGSMSIVGPRPHAVAHNEQYRTLVDRYMLRHKVKPGITGLAQISGFRGETDTLDKMEMRIKFDLKYIQYWSLGLDLKIIFLTVFKGFTGASVY